MIAKCLPIGKARGSVCRIALLLIISLAAVSLLNLPSALSDSAPDLTPINLYRDDLLYDTQLLTVTGELGVKIQNKGDEQSAVPFNVVAFEDSNSNGSFEPGVDNTLGTLLVNSSIDPGADIIVQVPVSGSIEFAWNLIYVFVDSGNDISELNESNNILSTGTMSQYVPNPGPFQAALEWSKTSETLFPEYAEIMMAPIVADLDSDGVVEILYCTFSSGHSGYLRVIDGRDGSEGFTIPHRVACAPSPAVGDIDDDGNLEIVSVMEDYRVGAIEHDGTLKWQKHFPANSGNLGGSPSLADLNGDGDPEVIYGAVVSDKNGNILWTGAGGHGAIMAGVFSTVADIDLDGSPEVVAGNTVYRSNGQIIWQAPLNEGFTSVGNLDEDPEAEIVLVTGYPNYHVYLLDTDGDILWGPLTLPSGGAGPALIADVDDDGEPEIGIAGGGRYVVFEKDGTVKWTAVVQDYSSQSTGSTAFDFNGDGSTEIVYADEIALRIFKGSDGTSLFEFPRTSGTLFEFPVVADVDSDGEAEIVTISNGSTRGIYVIGSLNHDWVKTRKIWNLYSYHVTNVLGDGTIPAHEIPNWTVPGLNNFRQNKPYPGEGTEFDAADVAPSFIRADNTPCTASSKLKVRVGNGGSEDMPLGTPIHLLDRTNQNSPISLGITQTTSVLSPGEYEDVEFVWNSPTVGYRIIEVRADDNGAGQGIVREGFEDNNTAIALIPICLWPSNDLLAFGAGGKVDLEWSLIPEAASYDLFRKTEGSPYFMIQGGFPPSQSTYTDLSVQNEVTYYYLLRWRDSSGAHRGESNEASATPYGLQCELDSPPRILSRPITSASSEVPYAYHVEAVDEDPGDVLTFSLLSGPQGLSINPSTGLITWLPPQGTQGYFPVSLMVKDRIGRKATQSYRITVAPTFQNRAPSFVSTPAVDGISGYSYVYRARAADPDFSDVLSFSLSEGPAGMTVSPSTGTVRWQIPNETSGDIPVTLVVRDQFNASATQSYTIVVAANAPPTFTSTPPTVGRRLFRYFYDAEALDPEGSTLTFSLITKPTGMRVNSRSGAVEWSPTLSQIGDFSVELRVTDEGGLIAEQEWTITVPANEPPVISSNPPVRGRVGVQYRYGATATDPDGDAVTFSLTTAPLGMTVSQSGEVLWTPSSNQTGDHSVTLRAADPNGGVSDQTWVISVSDANSGGMPQISSSSPEEGGEVKIETPIIASVEVIGGSLVDFSWRAELRRGDEGSGQQIGSGDSPFTNQQIGVLDPSVLQNDIYTLWITAVNDGWEVSRSFPYIVSGERKLGDFRTSATDLSVPLSGMPITITRTYRSIDTSKYEFGNGWRLALPGKVVDSAKETPLETFKTGTRVFVTRPDGRRVGFKFTPYLLHPLFPFWMPAFTPDPGVTDILEVPEDILFRSGDEFYELFGEYNPDFYYLSTRDRIRFSLSESNGLLEMRDANRNVISFTGNSISHSSGLALAIVRDGAQRISKITDANGKDILYGYDGVGNLSTVTDQEGNVWEYRYDSFHRLTEVEDPLNRVILTNFYDAAGRLYRQLDADGKELSISNDPGLGIQTITDRLGHETLYEYDQNGNLIRKRDHEGKEWHWSYDENFNVTVEIDPDGGRNDYTYDARSNLLSKTLAPNLLGVRGVYTYAYNDLDQIISETSPEGRSSSKTYDDYGNLISETDGEGGVKTYSYNSYGDVVSFEDSLGNESTFEYDPLGRVTEAYDAAGNVTSFTYDQNGNVLSQTRTRTSGLGQQVQVHTTIEYENSNKPIKYTDGEGKFTLLEYDPVGNVIHVVDKNGNDRFYEFDAQGRRRKVIYDDLTFDEYAYDDEGNLKESKDREGRITKYTYDSLNRRIRSEYPDTLFTETAYDDLGRVVSEKDERGFVKAFEYDLLGRKVAETSPLGHQTRIEYDLDGNETKVIDPEGRETRFQYDDAGRRTHTFFEDESQEVVAYDLEGRETSKTDQANRTTQYQYDVLGRLVSVIDALGQATQYVYDEIGNKVKQIDANGHETRFEYNNIGLVVKKTLPLGQFETMSYDGNGKKVSHTDFAGRATTFGYDSDNRLTSVTYPDLTTVLHEYFPSGARKKVTDSNGVTNYEYTLRDRIKKVTNPGGVFIEYGYDEAGNRTSLTTSEGGVTRYEFDADSRLTKVIDPSLGETLYEYSDAGNQTKVTYPNGNYGIFSYDDLYRLTRLETRSNANALLQSFEYGLDAVGNRLSVIEESGRGVSYQYDALYRLIQERIVEAGNPDRIIDYTYDGTGNRLSKVDSVEGATAYTYDDNDRLLTANGKTYSYDENGNQIEEEAGGSASSYEWDYEDRLIEATVPGGSTVQYRYDADDTLIEENLNGAVKKLLVDKNLPYSEVIEERDGVGTFLGRYVHGNDLILQSFGGSSKYFHGDGLGSTRALSSAAGAITDRYTYEAFGTLLTHQGTTITPYLFAGERFDTTTENYYLRARWMRPEVGRFVGRDPLPSCASRLKDINRYTYAANNPVNYKDPTGLFTETLTLYRNAILVGVGLAGTSQYFTQWYLSDRRGNFWRVTVTADRNGLGYVIGAGTFLKTAGILDVLTRAEPVVEEEKILPPFVIRIEKVEVGKDREGNCRPCPPNQVLVDRDHPHYPCQDHWHCLYYNQDSKCVCHPQRGDPDKNGRSTGLGGCLMPGEVPPSSCGPKG